MIETLSIGFQAYINSTVVEILRYSYVIFILLMDIGTLIRDTKKKIILHLLPCKGRLQVNK